MYVRTGSYAPSICMEPHEKVEPVVGMSSLRLGYRSTVKPGSMSLIIKDNLKRRL